MVENPRPQDTPGSDVEEEGGRIHERAPDKPEPFPVGHVA
jgi:hypothetical protein